MALRLIYQMFTNLLSWTDRALIAALTRLLPARRRLGLLITPATILRWHGQLIARRWTTQPTGPGRPAIPAGLRVWVPETRPTHRDLLLRRRRRPGMIPRWCCG
jgi:hypothetical protein